MNNFWPLNINNFTIDDRKSISNFIEDTKNRWTQDIQVKIFEQKFSEFIGCKYAIFVSSGSTANTMLAQYLRDTTKKNRNKIILPSTTWQTSCSPWIREGFQPIFIDISLDDFCIDIEKLEKMLQQDASDIACVFPTSLIGFSPNIEYIKKVTDKYNVKLMFDNCENTLGSYDQKNLSSYVTSTTSTYFGHQIQSVEGGFIFTDSLDEYEYFLMLRNHGMTRGLTAYGLDATKYQNNDVDSFFDFYCLGNNYRNTDINAFIGQLDLNRANYYKTKRIELYSIYYANLDRSKYYLPNINRSLAEDVPFCLPIISLDRSNKNKAIEICKNLSIEYRPIISGFLGRQTCYRSFFNNDAEYKNSVFLHDHGFYVGLHPHLEPNDIQLLCDKLNSA